MARIEFADHDEREVWLRLAVASLSRGGELSLGSRIRSADEALLAYRERI